MHALHLSPSRREVLRVGKEVSAGSRLIARPLHLAIESLMVATMGLSALMCLALFVQLAYQTLDIIWAGPIGATMLSPLFVAIALTLMSAYRLKKLGNPRAVGLSASLGAIAIGASTLVSHLVLGLPDPLWGAFTQTCSWTFSTLTPPPADCHYLCTVAAQGHPWLVKPERLGVRDGGK
jgi:hypothetical protein